MTEVVDSGFNIESRLRAIATNAVQEARVAHGRGADPFSDDDGLRIDTIFQLLHVHKKMEKEYEHFPLVSQDQVKSSATLLKISDLLDNLPENDALEESESVTVSVGLPKAANGKK